MHRSMRFALPLFLCLLIFQITVFAQTAWQAGTFYAVNTMVSYQTATYKCLQQHTGQTGWEPPNAPSLWELQTGGGNPNAIFADDFETNRGWTVNAASNDTAAAGIWERGTPNAFYYQGKKQLGESRGGSGNLVTGRISSVSINQNDDVDGGLTSIQSPAITLPASGNISLSFWFYFAHNSRSSSADFFRVRVIGATSQSVIFTENGRRTNDNAAWQEKVLNLNEFAGQTIRLQFETADNDLDSLTEAAVDDLTVTATTTAIPGPPFPARFFAPYVDVLLYPAFPLAATAAQTGSKFYTLAFITAGAGCDAKWGGIVGMSENYLISDLNALRTNGGNVIVSFGGASGTELAQACNSVSALQTQYQAVIDKYNLTHVDFDIEGGALPDAAANDRRNKAIRALQIHAQNQNRQLIISYTLPVLPSGLGQSSLNLLQNAVLNNVEVSAVNIMAMDYGAVANPNQMGQNAIDAGNATIAQLQNIFTGKTPAQLRQMLSITPMIGLNDVIPEVFTLADANLLLNFAQTNNIGRLSMWSMTRDKQCATAPTVSPVCSGITQNPFDFTNRFKLFTQ